jgi:hypothetical protein
MIDVLVAIQIKRDHICMFVITLQRVSLFVSAGERRAANAFTIRGFPDDSSV